MIRKFFYVLTALLMGLSAAHAQTDSLRYSVSGTVRDARSGSSLQSVNVFMQGRHHATVTNADGEFTLKSDIPIEYINFSHIGYRNASIPAEGGYLNVMLEPTSIAIAPAMVVSAEPRLLVLEAMRHIPDNYTAEDELLRCFYRETLQKRQRYIYVSETVARLFKTPYTRGVFRDAAAIEKSRVVLSQRKRDTLSVKFLGGPTQATEFDVVKNREILLSERELAYYRLEMGEPVSIGGRPNLTVKISPSAVLSYPLYYGTIYIDSETYAFSRLELSLDMQDENKATGVMLIKKPFGLRFHPRELSVTLDYRKDGDRWRINYLRSVLRFACDWRKRLVHTNYTSVNELVVTDKLPEAVPIPRNEQFRSRDALSDKAALFTDPDFWKAYNIIEPSTSLEHAVERLIKR